MGIRTVSLVTTLQLKLKATGRTATEVWIVHGGESTYHVVPLKFCRALLWKEDNRSKCKIVGITSLYTHGKGGGGKSLKPLGV